METNRVKTVVCKCGFKTFNPVPLSRGVKITSCQQPARVENEAEQPDLRPGQVEEFNLAKSGGICPANGAHTKCGMWHPVQGSTKSFWESIKSRKTLFVTASKQDLLSSLCANCTRVTFDFAIEIQRSNHI